MGQLMTHGTSNVIVIVKDVVIVGLAKSKVNGVCLLGASSECGLIVTQNVMGLWSS
jgi:hypothetical protein